MSVQAINEAQRTRLSHAQRGAPMRTAWRQGEALVGGSYLLAALALPYLAGVKGHFDVATSALYIAAFAVAANVRFDVGAGFTVPTQAVFVPMLFAVPVTLVPLLVPLALALGMVPRVLRREVSPSWLSTALGNSWFSLGAALVLALANDHSPRGNIDILVLALAAQLAFDFLASVVRDRMFGELDLRGLLEEVGPIYAIDLALSLLGVAAALASIAAQSQISLLLIVPLFAVLRFFSRERHERLEQLAELNDAYQGTARLLGDVVEADDAYTGMHCKSVVRLALDVAEALDLDADRTRNVEFGALLHDVGKIAIPKEIINKPGKLDEREWEIIKTHTVEGQRMLEQIGGFMREIGQIVRSSHEFWDGKGYPDRLVGEEIPIEARIVSACDAFSAMTTTRSYRTAMPLSAAIAELERCAGSQFDPHVVDGLVRALAQIPEDSELPDGSTECSPEGVPLKAIPETRHARNGSRPLLSNQETGTVSAGGH
jgi:putative nucleotidyltransferase with HDIG domain